MGKGRTLDRTTLHVGFVGVTYADTSVCTAMCIHERDRARAHTHTHTHR